MYNVFQPHDYDDDTLDYAYVQYTYIYLIKSFPIYLFSFFFSVFHKNNKITHTLEIYVNDNLIKINVLYAYLHLKIPSIRIVRIPKKNYDPT